MIENLKKYWFLGLVCLILLIGTVFFSKQQIDSTFTGKKVNGKDIVFAISNEYVNADEYYEALKESNAATELYRLFERTVLSALETSDEIKKQAAEDAKNQINYVSSQGSAKLDELEAAIIASGYSGLKELNILYENQAKLTGLQRTFINNNIDTVVPEYMNEKSPRIVSQIFIKMSDSSKPNEAELKKLDEVKKALEGGTSFEDAATTFSDDAQSSGRKGLMGFMDKSTKMDPAFITNAIATSKGQQSEWFMSSTGAHLIYVNEDSFEGLIEDDSFVAALAQFNPSITKQSVYLASRDLKVEFTDESLKKTLFEYLEIEVQ